MSVNHYAIGSTPAPRAARPGVSEFIAAVRDSDSRDPGGTFGPAAELRYIVGGYSDSLVLRRSATPAQRAASALAYVEANPDADSFGYWTDDKGRVWLDVVAGHGHLVAALSEAEANGELALWDSVRGEEIAEGFNPSGIGLAWRYPDGSRAV